MTICSYNQGGLWEVIAINGSAPKSKGHEANGNQKSRKEWPVMTENIGPLRNITRAVSSEPYFSQQMQRNHVLSPLMLRNIRLMSDSI